jgi:A/G-specific adenine glycosylase
MPRYTQALMDLGATVCLPRKAQCETCPVSTVCQGKAQGEPLAYPVKTRKLKRSSATLWLLWAVNAQGQVWLQKRPDTGIWAGLFSMPVFDSESALLAAWATEQAPQFITPWKHVLTHRDLHLHPVRIRGAGKLAPVCDGQWVDADAWAGMGLPAPIRTLLAS